MLAPDQGRDPEPDDQKGKLATVYRAAVVLNAVLAWTRVFSDSP